MRLIRPDAALDRRRFLLGAGAAAGLASATSLARAQAATLYVASRQIEVKRRAATVYGVAGPGGRPGLFAEEGDSFVGQVLNGADKPLTMHWHGQIFAPFDQDRARPGGGALASGAGDMHAFRLTPGTHWMHSHSLTEQQLLAAPMVTREKDAGDAQDVVVMLHDFSFRTPEEILAGLTGGAGGHGAHAQHGAAPAPAPAATDHSAHAGHAAPAAPAPAADPHAGHGAMPAPPAGAPSGMMMGGMMMGGMMMGGAPHANDVDYDAYLANDRTLDDPEVVRVERGGRVRLRVINGATATVFFIETGALEASCVAVDGTPCIPYPGRRFPLAQGQRIDLVVTMPPGGGAFPILAQVENDRRRTGLVLATPGADVTRVADAADANAPHADLSLDLALRAPGGAPPRAHRMEHIMLGEGPNYAWSINGAPHGRHTPIRARVGERVEFMFMNPTSMMHPMHLHGHHFQVIGGRGGRFAGPVRDTVIVPPHFPVFVSVQFDKPGGWFMHCHHLYHMAGGMMTEVIVS